MAADSTAVRAGRAFVEIFADDSALARGLKNASKKLKAWGAGLTSVGVRAGIVGAAMVSPFVAATKAFSDAGSELVDMSQRTGVSVEALSGLKYAAEQSGSTIEDFEGGLKNMHVALNDAAGGAKEARKKFADLHLSIAELKALPPDQAFLRIAEAISRIQHPSKQAATALDLLGKKGLMLLPLMRAGAAGIKAMTEEAARLGITMSAEDAIAAEAFGDKTAKAVTQIKTAFIRLGAAVLPVLEPIVDKFSDALKVTAKWINENRNLVVLALSAGAALLAFGQVASVVGSVLTAMGAVIGGVITAAAAFGAALYAVGSLATPTGLALVAVLGALSGMVNWSKLTRDALVWLGSVFGTLKDEAVTTMSAIGKAIASGNIQAAAKLLWAFLNLQWQKGTTQLLAYWYQFTEPAVTAWNNAVFAMADAGNSAFWNIQSAFGEVSNWIAKTANAAAFEFSKTWIGAMSAVSVASVQLRALFDDNVDVAGEMLAIAQKTGSLMTKAVGNNVSNQAEIDKQAEARRAGIEAGRKASEGLIDAASKSAQEKSKANREKSLGEAEAELAKAREEWAKAVEAAKPSTNGMEKLKNASPGISDLLGNAGGGSVFGTFNAAGVRGLATGGGLQVLVGKISELTNEVKGARREINDAPILSPAG